MKQVFLGQCGVLGQVWYLVVSIPDLCFLLYFYKLMQCHYKAVGFAI